MNIYINIVKYSSMISHTQRISDIPEDVSTCTSVCMYSMFPSIRYMTQSAVKILICTCKHMRERSGNTTQRPTNLKRGRSERVSWRGAEEKSTETVTPLQRRDKRQQL